MTGIGPIDEAAFAEAMEAFEPFEPEPLLAVAVSGGPDSMALSLLADRWARARKGRILAVTVDHGLRPDSAAETRKVAAWMAARGIAHRVLCWRRCAESGLRGGVQEAARNARHALLEEICRERNILHLLLAHTRDDQAETVLLRLARGSGPDGLAAIPACRETRDLRLLRPLLAASKATLLATCRAFGQDWVEDPSNATPHFARGRLRAVGDALAAEGLGHDSLALSAGRAGGLRRHLDAEVAAFLAAAVTVRPEGYLTLDASLLESAPSEIAKRAVARCLMIVGGEAYPPRHARLMRLLDDLRRSGPRGEPRAGATLAGCQIVAEAAGGIAGPGGRHWLVLREPAKALACVPAVPGRRLRWDRRFLVGPLEPAAGEGACTLRRLDREGAALLAGAAVPAAVRAGLPGLWRDDRLVGLPEIVLGEGLKRSNLPPFFRMVFAPPEPLAGAGFCGIGSWSGMAERGVEQDNIA